MGIPGFASVRINHTICCYEDCQAIILMPDETMQRFIRNHKWFYCYGGHAQRWTGKSAIEKLKHDLARKDKELEWARNATRKAESAEKLAKHSARALKGVVTRTKNRVKNGVCPCCKRSFVDLHRHMTTKHPKYGAVT